MVVLGYLDLQSIQNNGPYTLYFGCKGHHFGYFGGPGTCLVFGSLDPVSSAPFGSSPTLCQAGLISSSDGQALDFSKRLGLRGFGLWEVGIQTDAVPEEEVSTNWERCDFGILR